MSKRSLIICLGSIISLGAVFFWYTLWESKQDVYIKPTFETQSAAPTIPSSCLTNDQFPSVVMADKTTFLPIPAKETYTLLVFCAPQTQDCDSMTLWETNIFSQREENNLCHISIAIPYAQWATWLKTTITAAPFYAKHSMGVDTLTREAIKSKLIVSIDDNLPHYFLIDDCGKIVEQTTVRDDVENAFSPYCGEVIHPVCGNGIVENNEMCDDGNQIDTDTCTTSCKITFCGDAIINTPNNSGKNETCDDGNHLEGDGCSTDCVVEEKNTRYCDTDNDSFYGHQREQFNINQYPYLIVQQAWETNQFVYCTFELWCRYVPCRHEAWDDCDDSNGNLYTPDSYCEKDGEAWLFDATCSCVTKKEEVFTTQSVEDTTPLVGRCWSPDGASINYPQWENGEIAWVPCTLNNCSYYTQEACYFAGGICYYFCTTNGQEDYLMPPCAKWANTERIQLHTCQDSATCGKKWSALP